MKGRGRILLLSAVICIFLPPTAQNSRKKRQIQSDQPRILTQNGHLIFQSGTNHNITLRTAAGGAINVDGENVKSLAQSVRSNKAYIDQLRNTPSSGGSTGVPSNVINQLNTLKSRLDNLQPTGQVQMQLASVRNRVRTLETNTPPNINTRLTSLENQQLNLQPTGQVQSQLRTLSARMGTVESRVRTLQQNRGSSTSSRRWNRTFRRLSNRVRTLSNQVANLRRLLTRNECSSNPCQNGGECLDMYNGFLCKCPEAWQGPYCSNDVNECVIYGGTDLGCQNGATCMNTPGSFNCRCTTNWHGVRCTESHDDCSGASQSELCGHGTCINVRRVQQGQPKYRCICDDGWTTANNNPACTVDVNECSSRNPPCSQDPLVPCVNIPGSFHCGLCPAGYSGNGFSCVDVNECLTNNGGCSQNPVVECVNTRGSRSCSACPPGFQGNGVSCTWVGLCAANNGGCYPQATCRETPGITGRSCTCPPGYAGSGVGAGGCVQQSTTGPCASAPCQNGACQVSGNSYNCVCNTGYAGRNCETDIQECASSPCQNGGTCVDHVGSYSCQCTGDYTGRNCEQAQQICGGTLRGENGSFRFPRTSGTTYPHGVNCAWTITTTRNKILILTFPHFDIESHSSCNYDYLQIHDGPTASSHMIGKYCGTSPPNGGSLNSTHNQLYLWFYTDASVTATGFQVNWVSADPVCGGDLSGSDHGTISSPGYPGNYPHNRDCIWMVTVSPGHKIQFAFASLAIESHPNCSYDYLEISDVLYNSSPLIQIYCSSSSPAPITTRGQVARVKFHTDNSLSDTGFHITYASVRADCGGSFTSEVGVFTSPNYPNPYNHRDMCAWAITVPSGDVLTLTFTNFNLEGGSACSYDFVEVRDGNSSTSPLLGRYCSNDSPAPVQSTGNQMYIFFRSDVSIRGSGFRATWTTACGGTYTSRTGVLQSPSYPNFYPHNKECIYTINQPNGFRVILTFTAFNLERQQGNNNCVYDSLEVRNGGSSSSPLLGRFCGSQLPAMQVTTQYMMWLKFKTDGSVTNTGFRATFRGEEVPCGAELTSNGNFTSPGHPNRYPHGANCTWYIILQPGLLVQLTFSVFALERHSRCRFDYVAVYDNSTANANSQLGRYCGRTLPPVVTSSENVMTVVFRTDSSVAYQGFMASVVGVNASTMCGSFKTDPYGVITSPGYPNNYPHERECIWTITVLQNKQILLNITDFQIESHPDCNFDYLEIRNGGFPTSPLVGKYCGLNVPSTVVSHGNRLWLKFKSDTSFSARGFRIVYDGTATGCGGDMSTPSGSFISPNYPQRYSHNAVCFWTITVSRGILINLTFVDFDLEGHSRCGFDYVQIRDGGPRGSELAKYCGRQVPPPVTSTTNVLWIKYRTDFSVSGRGFHAVYSTSCNVRLSSSTGVIESPNFPNPYPHSRNCTWIVNTTRGNSINASFSHFEIESHSRCRHDFVQFRDGNSTTSPLIGKYCGNTIPPPVATTGDHLWINFRSDASVALNGFRLEWITNGCGGEFTGQTGTFTSPNYPNPYPHRRQCNWKITVPTGHRIQLTIDPFDLEVHRTCRYDALEVFSGPDSSAPRLAQLCHVTSSPQVLTTTGNTMFILFRTDASVAGNGFSATYQTLTGGCGGNVSLPVGIITSPNYPNNYPHRTDCQWLITVQEDRPVVFTFLDFYLEGPRSCPFDWVALYDGPDMSYPQLARHCGSSLPSPAIYRASTNQVYVRMRTDSSVSRRGFKAQFKTGCGRIFNAETDGELFSPNYPAVYDRSSNCSWLIQASHNSDRVTLTFTHMDIEDRRSCGNDYVRVLDGNDADSPEIGTYCGSAVPPPITTQGSALFIIFVSDLSDQRTGFRATFTKSSSSCGGNFTAESGSFTSPAYPNSYPINTECVWTIQGSPGNSVMVSFSVFNLQYSDNCDRDYLEMRESDVNGRLIGRYCYQAPANLTAYNGIWIKFRSDDSVTGSGFIGTYSSVCGGAITGTSGQISSPLYPRAYPHRIDCTWTVTVPSGMRIRINFVTMDMEGSHSRSCYFDYLRFRDGGLVTSPEIAKFCGTTLPDPVLTTTNQLRTEFHTDMSVTGQGFLFSWVASNEMPVSPTTAASSTTPVPGCGGDLVATETIQTISSPGFPNGYANNLRCTWRISSVIGTRIWLNITSIDIERHSACFYDTIKIYNSYTASGSVLNQFCGRTGNTAPIVASSNAMSIRFTTDRSINGTGFSINIKTTCGGSIRQTQGVVRSPGYPGNYPANANCPWTIQVPTGRTVRVQFNGTFNIPSTSGCGTDYVMLLNGGSSSSPSLGNGTNRQNTLGRYCGSTRPDLMVTSSNRLFVNFVSDSSGAGSGFTLIFSEIRVTCGDRLRLTDSLRSAYFTSPNYPASYPQNVDCVWIITAPARERIQIDFEGAFSIEQHSQCNFDYIEIRDGGTQNAHMIGSRHCGTTLPSTQVSTGNVMYVRFRTDSSIRRTGFKARYQIATCGGRINGNRGTIRSPNYPSNYDNNLDCEWFVTAPTGHYITFTFQAFRMQYSTNCSADFLEIREYNSTGTSLLRQCGRRRISSVDTSDSFAYVHFKSNEAVVRTGFSISFQASVEVCGGDLTTPVGTFTSPNFPGLYAHNRLCEWRITVPSGRRVTLSFDAFQLERARSRSCTWDHVSVYNGLASDSPRLGRFCGDTVPGIVESSGNTMRVVFRTDHSVTNGGFRASYTSNNEAECGGILTTSGNISSPGFSDNGNYTNNLNCIWTINNPNYVNTSIKIYMRSLRLEPHVTCLYDFVRIREGSTANGAVLEQFCGNNTRRRRHVVSPSTQLFVRFRTDMSIVDRGFFLLYEFTSCGGILTDQTGVITSPNYPQNYGHNVACAWKIVAPDGVRIRVTFVDLSLESHRQCVFDFLEILNGGNVDSPSIGKFCTQQPGDFLSQSSSLRIIFQTDFSVASGGFMMRYSFESGGCGGLFHSNTGYLASPNYPRSYPHNTECVWDINVGLGYTAQLTFNPPFDLQFHGECVYDYVEVSDSMPNGTLVPRGRWCTNITPPNISSTGRRLVVKFRSDFSTNGNGFSANWTSSCGGLFTSDTGTIVSPNYPRPYENNLLCNYTISVDPQKYILLSFDAEFHLERGQRYRHHNDCPYDYVAVYAGNNTRGRRLGRFCGSTRPQPVSSLATMFMQFRTDHSLVFKGFRATYKAEECGGVYTASSGYIRTPTHPSSYHNNANCTWVITVEPNRVVDLKFVTFAVEAHSRCNFDYVEVRDGNSINAPLLGRYCGDTVPDVIRTTGNSMFINFVTDRSVTLAGFSGGYRTTIGEAQGCGGYLNGTSGTLTSAPLDLTGDGRYENNLDCAWGIFVTINKVATINITDMDIERHRICRWDYIKVYDGISKSDPLLGKFCGQTPPGLIIGSTNALYFVFHTDISVRGAGFNATYGERNALCGGVKVAGESPQTISTPNYPNPVGQAARCRWTIGSSVPSKQVQITFSGFSLAQDTTCSQEYVELRDHPLGTTGRSLLYCGTTIPPQFDSVGRDVQVNYNVPEGSRSQGFILTYQWASCNKNFTGNNGRIVSPGYPGRYQRNLDCDIRIVAPAGTTLALYFTMFQIESHSNCNFDYLEIHSGNDSGPLLAKVCGNTIPDPVFVQGNTVYMNFKTDSSVARSGYDISFTSTTQGLGCGGNITGISGSLTSPGFPGNYSEVRTCRWLITVPARRNLRLIFTSLTVLGVARCAENYVAVYNGNSESAPIFGRYCDSVPSTLQVTGTNAYVKFVSTGSSSAPTFRLTYTS